MNIQALKRDEVKIVSDNPEEILAEMIDDYEQRTGKTLQPAHIERLLMNTFAYRETLVRHEINESYRQQHVRFATGLMLDLCGDDVNTPRLDGEDDEAYRERVLLAPESFSVAGSVGAYQYWTRAVSPEICDVHVANALDSMGNAIGGTVAVTVLTQTGLPNQALLSRIHRELSGEKRRPLCDTVSVHAPATVDYVLNAELVLFTGANALEVQAAAQQAWTTYETHRREKLGGDIVPLDIQTVLKVAGVYNVVLTAPVLTVVQPNQWARCVSVRIRVNAEQQDG